MPISFSRPSTRDARGAGVTAVLGPTNTGKTHLAIERMLAHSSGMIGLPLRLLAREVYNKCVEKRWRGAGRAHYRRREDQAAEPALLGLDPGGDAARPRCVVRRDRRNSARRRSRTRACVHRPHAQPARPRRDAGARRGDHAQHGGEAASGREHPVAPAPLDAELRGREEIDAPAAPLRHRGVLGGRSVCDRRIDPPPARRCRRGSRLALARAPATRRSRSTSRAMWIIWSRPTRSAWGSISTSIMWRSRPTANSTATSSASSTPPNSARSRAVPAARCATARSAPPAAARRSSPNWCSNWRATPSIP